MADLRTLVRQLAALFERAPSMPLMRSRVRVDKRDAEDLAAAIEDAVRRAVDRGELAKEAAHGVVLVMADMREELLNAYPVPLTDQVRVERSRAVELSRELRAAVSDKD